MGESNVDLVRQLYGFDWIGLVSREEGFGELGKAMDPGFRGRVSPELGDRELHGVEGLVNFVDALEEDFESFRYEPEEITEAGKDSVVVWGTIFARGRNSKMPLTSGFGHVWTLRDGKALRVEAFLDRRAAERAAGL
jgi:ketosteroid isomerase-like protein